MKLNWKIFNDSFEQEIKSQEFRLDEAQWNALIKSIKLAQESMEKSL